MDVRDLRKVLRQAKKDVTVYVKHTDTEGREQLLVIESVNVQFDDTGHGADVELNVFA